MIHAILSSIKIAVKAILGKDRAKSIARKLGLQDDLAHTLTLAEIDWVSRKYTRPVVQKPILKGNLLYLDSYSVVNNPVLLSVLKKICYGKRDIRAGWIGAGIPHTDSSDYKPLAQWATQHWAMYSGFLHLCSTEPCDILDVGCGTGHATVCLATIFAQSTVTGIDIDDTAIRFAKRFNKKSNVHYIHGDFLLLRCSKRYRYIFALEILEHLASELHYRFIDECLSMLTDEGFLFVTTPNALDDLDATYAHVGLLNRARAHAFIDRYNDRILDGFFYDNRELLSADPSRFVVHDSIYRFEDTGRNRSHFCLVMR